MINAQRNVEGTLSFHCIEKQGFREVNCFLFFTKNVSSCYNYTYETVLMNGNNLFSENIVKKS